MEWIILALLLSPTARRIAREIFGGMISVFLWICAILFFIGLFFG